MARRRLAALGVPPPRSADLLFFGCRRDPPPPPPPRTKWTRRVPHPVLIGHAASLSQVQTRERGLPLQVLRPPRRGPRHPAPPLVLIRLARDSPDRKMPGVPGAAD